MSKTACNALIELDGRFMPVTSEDAIANFVDGVADFVVFFATPKAAVAAMTAKTREQARKAPGCTGYNERKF